MPAQETGYDQRVEERNFLPQSLSLTVLYGLVSVDSKPLSRKTVRVSLKKDYAHTMRTKSEARRQAIIDTARVVFSEQGFAETSMSSIAAKLGGSKATLYNYFASKEELFVAIIQQFAAEHLCEVYRLLDIKVPLRDALESFGAGFIAIICNPEVTTTRVNLFMERGKSDIGTIFYERGPKQGLGIVSNYFQQCIDLGRLRPDNTFIMAQQMFALLKSEGEELIFCGIRESFSSEEIQAMVKRAVDVFLRAYGTGIEN